MDASETDSTDKEESEKSNEKIEENIENNDRTKNQIFNKELSKSLSLIEDEKKVEEERTLTKEEESVPPSVEESLVPELRYTSHPISMEVKDCDIKMVDLASLFLNYRKSQIAPDGFIPNSEIRSIIKKPYIDCLLTKIKRRKIGKDVTKKVLEDILLKYLPEDLVIEPKSQMQTIHDMAKLVENRQARSKPIITLDDNEDFLNEATGEDDVDGVIQNISMKTTKSKRKKYARQITKAAMMNQIEKKVKEKEERRRIQIQKEEDSNIFLSEENKRIMMESKEAVDIDVLEDLDQRLKDGSIINRKKEKEKSNIRASLVKVNIDSLFKALFREYGEELTYSLIFSALKNDENAIKNIDKIVKGRQNRLFVLNAATLQPYAFNFISSNLGNEDTLINIGLMMEDPKFGNKDTLEDLQKKITEILGNETRMVQFLSQLSFVLSCANEKLKGLTDKSISEILLSAFKNMTKEIGQLRSLVGNEENRIKFMNLIRQCNDKEIESFIMPERKFVNVDSVERTASKHDSESDFYGDLTIEQRGLVPAKNIDMQEGPIEFIGTIARVLKLKTKKDKDEAKEDDSIQSTPKLSLSESSKTVAVQDSESVIKEEKVIKSKISKTESKEHRKDLKKKSTKIDIKSDIKLDVDLKIEIKPDDERSESKKRFQVIGTGVIQSIEESNKINLEEVAASMHLSPADLMKSYYERLLVKPWWPDKLTVEISNDGIIIGMTKILNGIGKVSHHLDASHCIIEFKRMFPTSKSGRNKIIEILYDDYNEDSAQAKRAVGMDNIPSHAYYCKRTLNDLSLLLCFGEDIEDIQSDFLKNYGTIKLKKEVQEETKVEDIDEIDILKLDAIESFDPVQYMKILEEQVGDDYTPSSDIMIMQLLEALKSTVDPNEKMIISNAIQKMTKIQDFSQLIKDEIITETSATYALLKSDLESRMIEKNPEEQQKLYKQLVKTSKILHELMKDGKDLLREGILQKLPTLEEIQHNPSLLSATVVPSHETELYSDQEIEPLVKVSDENVEIDKIDKPKIVLSKKEITKLEKKTDVSKAKGVASTSKDLKGLHPTIAGSKIHEKGEKRLSQQFDKKTLKNLDKSKGRTSHRKIAEEIDDDISEHLTNLEVENESVTLRISKQMPHDTKEQSDFSPILKHSGESDNAISKSKSVKYKRLASQELTKMDFSKSKDDSAIAMSDFTMMDKSRFTDELNDDQIPSEDKTILIERDNFASSEIDIQADSTKLKKSGSANISRGKVQEKSIDGLPLEATQNLISIDEFIPRRESARIFDNNTVLPEDQTKELFGTTISLPRIENGINIDKIKLEKIASLGIASESNLYLKTKILDKETQGIGTVESHARIHSKDIIVTPGHKVTTDQAAYIKFSSPETFLQPSVSEIKAELQQAEQLLKISEISSKLEEAELLLNKTEPKTEAEEVEQLANVSKLKKELLQAEVSAKGFKPKTKLKHEKQLTHFSKLKTELLHAELLAKAAIPKTKLEQKKLFDNVSTLKTALLEAEQLANDSRPKSELEKEQLLANVSKLKTELFKTELLANASIPKTKVEQEELFTNVSKLKTALLEAEQLANDSKPKTKLEQDQLLSNISKLKAELFQTEFMADASKSRTELEQEELLTNVSKLLNEVSKAEILSKDLESQVKLEEKELIESVSKLKSVLEQEELFETVSDLKNQLLEAEQLINESHPKSKTEQEELFKNVSKLKTKLISAEFIAEASISTSELKQDDLLDNVSKLMKELSQAEQLVKNSKPKTKLEEKELLNNVSKLRNELTRAELFLKASQPKTKLEENLLTETSILRTELLQLELLSKDSKPKTNLENDKLLEKSLKLKNEILEKEELLTDASKLKSEFIKTEILAKASKPKTKLDKDKLLKNVSKLKSEITQVQDLSNVSKPKAVLQQRELLARVSKLKHELIYAKEYADSIETKTSLEQKSEKTITYELKAIVTHKELMNKVTQLRKELLEAEQFAKDSEQSDKLLLLELTGKINELKTALSKAEQLASSLKPISNLAQEENLRKVSVQKSILIREELTSKVAELKTELSHTELFAHASEQQSVITQRKLLDSVTELKVKLSLAESNVKEDEINIYFADGVKPLLTSLQDLKARFCSKLSQENQNTLDDLIRSQQNNDDDKMSDLSEKQLFLQILNGMYSSSYMNQATLNSVTKELLQNFFEKKRISNESKMLIENALAKDLEKLRIDLSKISDDDEDNRNDLLKKIHKLLCILQKLNTTEYVVEKRIEDVIKKMSNVIEDNYERIVQNATKNINLETYKILNDPEFMSFIKTTSDDSYEYKIERDNINKHLIENKLTTKENLNYPENVINDLIFQRRLSMQDTDKFIRISQAMFSIVQDVMKNNKELMEIVATEAFTNLIVDMQNLLSQSLKQYEIPITLIRSTTNLLLLQNIGIFGLDDFEEELQTYKGNFPNEVNFAKNPLLLEQLTKEFQKLNMSKNELRLDNNVTFLRNISDIKPMGLEKAFEKGLIMRRDDSKDNADDDFIKKLFSNKVADLHQLPAMYKMGTREQNQMLEDYKYKGELRDNMRQIETLVRHRNKAQEAMFQKWYKDESFDSLVEMARDERPGSKTHLMKIIRRTPALIAIANIGTVLNLKIDSKCDPVTKKTKFLKSNYQPKTQLPFIKTDIVFDASKRKEDAQLLRHSPALLRLPPIHKYELPKNSKIKKEDRQKKKSEKQRKLIKESSSNDFLSNLEEKYGSMVNLRSRIKEEICKEYPFLADKIDFDELVDKVKTAQIIPKPVTIQKKQFQRLFGKETTILPFIGMSKSDIGNVLDQGLRALHFNLGPGTLVRAIIENEKNVTNKNKEDKPDWWKADSTRIDSLIEEDHTHHAVPMKYLTNVQLKHCRMTNRPSCIPIHEWSKVTVPGSCHNLRPDLFDTIHKTYHCPHSLLADKHLHRHGISIISHLQRYEMIEIINKSVQENAYVRIQNSLLKCLIRVLEDR